MSEIRQQPPTQHGKSVAKKRKRIPETKNNSVAATGFAIGSSVMTFWTMFGFEVQSFRCDSRPRFRTICEPLGMANADFISLLFYSGIVLGAAALIMLMLTFMMKLPDFPRWILIVFRIVFLVVIIAGMAFGDHR